MQDKNSSVDSLLLMARSRLNDPEYGQRTVSMAQIRALHTRFSNTKITLTRAMKLDALRIILGFSKPISSTKNLSMGDVMGLLDMDDLEFSEVVWWAVHNMQLGALI